ncbi:MAG: hypothetical protein V2A34_07220, partial [Lentisphaerota bacterium]
MKVFGFQIGDNETTAVIESELETSAATMDLFASERAASGIPTEWQEQAILAWKYYKEEPIVNNCINAWRTLAVGEDFTILVSGDAKLQKEMDNLKKRLRLKKVLKDNILQLLTKGEGTLFKEYGGEARGTDEAGNTQYQDFERVKVLNPAELTPVVEDGILKSVTQKKAKAKDDGQDSEAGSTISLAQFR